MKLLTEEIRERLLKNGALHRQLQEKDPESGIDFPARCEALHARRGRDLAAHRNRPRGP